MANGQFNTIKYMADLRDQERMRVVEKLRWENQPGTERQGWLLRQGGRLWGQAGHLLVTLGQSLKGFGKQWKRETRRA